MLNAGKLRQIAAATANLGKPGNFGDRRVRIWRCGQIRSKDQFRNTHRLVDKNLFLIFAALAPLQNWLDRDDRRFEFKRALQQQGSLERWRWIFPARFDDRNRHCFGGRLRMSNQPPKKNFLGTLESRFAQEQNAEQRYDNDDRDRWPFHRRK